MKKAALALTAFLVSVSCLQSSAWSKPSLLMQMPAILAATQKSDTTQIMIGEKGIITAFKGKTLRSNIKIYHGYALADSTTYEYSTVTGPSGLSVSADGVISYAVPASADTQSTPVSLRVKEKATGKSYTKDVQLVVMATEIIASGTVGPTGGRIADEFEEVVVTVPEGAVEGQTLIEVLRAVDENGYYTYTINSSAPLLKILQMRLPDPILRKAPEESLAALQSKKSFQRAGQEQSKTMSSAGGTAAIWHSWKKEQGRYLWVFTVDNYTRLPVISCNRLRADSNEEPSGINIINDSDDSYELLALCSKDSYDAECGGKTPVIFIHGFTPVGFGGGEGTWGKFPELLAAEGYAVFEFKWRTNERFADAAADLANAIASIKDKTKKKVHIIAHSFGGLVTRAYLQNYATGRSYQDDIQSIVTLGTPHSGIFDEGGTYHGLEFAKGQDSTLFEGCLQLSCHQAGEPADNAYTLRIGIGPLLVTIGDLSSEFGINKNPGEFVAQIQNTSGEHGLPVDALVLMGLPRYEFNITKYRTGDGLITYAGQRFDHTWADSIITKPAYFGTGKVTEKILGVSEYDSNARPGELISENVLKHWGSGPSAFAGYFHSNAVPTVKIVHNHASEPTVNNNSVIPGTDTPHASLTEIKTWLKLNPTESIEPLAINLNLQVVDADTQQPVVGAEVYFDAGSSCTAFPSYTDASGRLSVQLPFYSSSKYTALVRANGYRSGEFDTGYVTGATPELSGTEFGTIKLQAGKVPTVTSATGRIWMDRNLGASRVATSMTDTQAYGDLYQWGRGKDGHEKRTSGTTTTLSSTDNPGHGNFITAAAVPYDWRSSKNDNLWQGVSGTNNPCPTGFRVPTADEWQEEMNSWSSKDAAGAFASPLKITLAGKRSLSTGTFNDVSGWGDYWASTVNGSRAESYSMSVLSNNAWMNSSWYRADALSVRCIKDEGVNEGLIAHYEFEDNANDSSGNGNNGVAYGGVSYVNGVKGKAVQIGDCSNPGHIQVPNSDSLKFNNVFTVSYYVRIDSETGMDGWGSCSNGFGARAVFAKDHDQNGYFNHIGINSSGTFTSFFSNNRYAYPKIEASAIKEGSFGIGGWTHVALVINGNEIIGYINGQETNRYNGLNVDLSIGNSRDLYIGKFGDSWYPLGGSLDDFRLYNRALSGAEIMQIYNEVSR